MNMKNLEAALIDIKSIQGYPAIFEIEKNKQKIEDLCKDGFNVMYLFQENGERSW